jgi:parallel beta-helix repeat protein
LVLAAAFAWMTVSSLAPCLGRDEPARIEIQVGVDAGDIKGCDNRALQAAVDHVASMGGGTMRIGPGRYEMRNALRLRDNVRIVGVPGETILAACDGARSPLSCDGDCNERQITLDDPSAFRVGDGVSIQDDDSGGFAVTTATLTSRIDEHTFTISAPLYLDYMISKNASAQIAFPVVGGWGVKNAAVEGLTIEGNARARGRLDGCRGGGIYLFECADVLIRDCTVRNYNGDGISFQVSENVTVEHCLAEGNTGLGLHPGSGSKRPTVRENIARHNGGDGLFVCWRVKHGLFENNDVHENQGAGMSIGHKDTDNLFRNNTFARNSRAGIFFRNESDPMGAHRNVFENNHVVDNGRGATGQRAEIEIRGHHRDLVFRGNTIGPTTTAATEKATSVGILRSPNTDGLHSEGNTFLNVSREVASRSE